jgi:ribonuclease J
MSRNEEPAMNESDVETQVEEICRKADNLVFGYCSSQNIDRIVSFYRAARHAGRKLVVDIYTAHILKLAAEKAKIPVPGKFPDVLVYYPHSISSKIESTGGRELLYQFQPYKITKEEIGQNRSSILMLVRPSARKDLARIAGLEGSVLVYSLWDGYLKKEYTAGFIEWMEGRGCRIEHVHSGGHATITTLKKVIAALSPKYVIPVHTEKPEGFPAISADIPVLLCRDGQPDRI